MRKEIAVVILAAGKGERMKSDLPKVLHSLCGRPMLEYVLDLVKALRADQTIAVLGHQSQLVRQHLNRRVKIVLQKRLRGTGDALIATRRVLKNFSGNILVLYGDHPLFKKETIERLIKHHTTNGLDITLLTAKTDSPQGYGRILRDKYNNISAIVEENQANSLQKEIREVNLGAACFNSRKLFHALRQIKANNPKKEYYLTDVVALIYRDGGLIESVGLKEINQALGINSYADLVRANQLMQERIHEALMQKGVKILDPRLVYIDWGVRIAEKSEIYPFTVIERGVKIGKNCRIGPFCHLRSGVSVKDNALIGNFVEAVRTKIGADTLIKHFSYLGDSRVGDRVNIGAGSITANFDGKKKNVTVIKDGAFIGSDTVLIAPVVIGKRAITGAGAVITKHTRIPPTRVAVGVPARILKKRAEDG